MDELGRVGEFLEADWFAVVGASPNREKYGNKVLRAYQQAGKEAVPIHPAAEEVEGVSVSPSLTRLMEQYSEKGVPAISVITPPAVTEKVMQEAVELGIRHVWLQPGAENEEAKNIARNAGINLIAEGPCVLVQLRFRDI